MNRNAVEASDGADTDGAIPVALAFDQILAVQDAVVQSNYVKSSICRASCHLCVPAKRVDDFADEFLKSKRIHFKYFVRVLLKILNNTRINAAYDVPYADPSGTSNSVGIRNK